MLKKTKNGLFISIAFSLSLHLISLTADQIDWNLSIQWKALKESIARIKNHTEKDSIGIKENTHNKEHNHDDKNKKDNESHQNKTMVDAIKEEVSKIKQGYAQNSKLRFAPDSKEWKELDELLGAKKKTGQKEKSELGKIEFLDNSPPKPIKISMISAKTSNENKMNIQFAKKLAECGEGSISYGGVGLTFQESPLKPNTVIITQVASGYPADRAGLKIGDELNLNPVLLLRGEVGTPVTVSFMRNEQQFTVTMIREKVCYHHVK